ncbi:copper resistance CopC/CopD family protein [Actinoplanes flavus]|uniref:Copper resistance protein CopC n=1 Tax=Actinoplanes flavus TaxID=2820290 RepID=A0ABS3UCR9_9ACTN|nr:copper resistance protein CopC [Actinoplanes flavus]MBO3736570.1 copper resistance protein CopC [Actinoplanes flavus]
MTSATAVRAGRPRRRFVVGAAAIVGALAVLLGPATPAQAHAVITATSPAQGSVVSQAPRTVQLAFNEPVRVIAGRTQVIAPDGKRINAGDPVTDGQRLTVTLRDPARPLGTYVVSYRIISADNHAIAGAFTFSVGAPSATTAGIGEVETRPGVQAAVAVAKYAGYAGLTLTVGPLLVLLVFRPRRWSWRGPLLLASVGGGVLAAGTVASLWLQVPYVSGAGVFDVSGTELRQTMVSGYGLALLARLGLIVAACAVVAYLVRARRSRAARVGLAVVGLVALVTWPLAGHPMASAVPAVMASADVVHLAGMSVWVGGLVALLAFVVPRAHARQLRLILPVWSRWAAVAVYWLVATGVVQALVQTGALGQLTGTVYGRLLLVKVGLVVAVLAAAAYARRLVRRRAGDSARALRFTMTAEAGIAALILAASSLLTQATPARSAGVEAAATATAKGFVTTLNSNLYAVQFEIFPAQVGEYNTFHGFAYTPEGKPLDVAEWKLTAALPAAGIEPMDNPVGPLLGNQGLGNVAFPIPGQWTLTLTVRTSDIDQATVTTTVQVR